MACGGSESSQQGYAVFIVNIEPNGNQGAFEFQQRRGAREDCGNLQYVFSDNLGFEWINSTSYWQQNLTVGRWDHRKKSEYEVPPNPKECCIRCHIQSLDHSQSKCFVLAISSHGRELKETEIIFSDGQTVCLTEFIDALKDENCPSLKGIPRVIILQACRSNFEDKDLVEKMQCRGVPIQVEMSEQSGTDNAGTAPTSGRTSQPHPVPTIDQSFQLAALQKMPEHFLLVYPVVSGQRAQCNDTDGSWLIYGLQKMFKEHYADNQKPVNIFQLFTLVSGYIAREKETKVFKHKEGSNEPEQDDSGNKIVDEDRSGVKNAVCIHHKLVKPLILSQKEKAKEIKELDPPNFLNGPKKKKSGK